MTINYSFVMGSVALAFTVISVILSIIAQRIVISDNMDKFIDDLYRQGRWAMSAALFQAFAVIILVLRLIYTGDV